MHKTLQYAGKVADALGRIIGPDHKGAWFEAVRSEYDHSTDTTHIEYRLVGRDDPRSVMPDLFGELRVLDD